MNDIVMARTSLFRQPASQPASQPARQPASPPAFDNLITSFFLRKTWLRIAALNILEKKTLNEMKDTLEELKASVKSEVDKYASLQDELKQLRDAIQDIGDNSNQEIYLIASIKCQDKIQLFEKYRQNFVKSSITFQPYSEIVQYISEMSGLGKIEHGTKKITVQRNPDKIIKLNSKSENGAYLNEIKCLGIRDICVLLNGQVLIADSETNEVKLLNQQYHLVSHCSVSDEPSGICQITPHEVAVTVGSAVQFFQVKCCQLVTDRKLQLQHDCKGIAYHEEDLFVDSDTALYKYTLSGELFSKLHEVKEKEQK
ncbi:hypothetical protein DPMN_078899 [Dreissena polymorpha]|uniref:Uncharacterized protein n=1 Tax=Dreissena polymorpha TaxID=45954 RepID=A0A9D3YN41_DREPO|nr:hypothetical protein DPMN_078899 [Dreissena polymorpha]